MLLFTIPIAILFNILTSIFNKTFNKILSYVLVLGVIIIFIAQLVYYKTYLSIFSFYSMANGTLQVMEFADTIVRIILNNILFISLLLIPLLVFLFFNKYFINYDKSKFSKTIIMLALLVIFQLIGSTALMFTKNQVYSVYELYYETHSLTLSANNLGLLTTMRLDFKRMITNFKEKSRLGEQPVIEEPQEDVKYNIMDINFDELITNEKNETINDMHKYFKNVMPTSQNEYTSKFKGKNLIYLMGESFNLIAIDKDITPTLYKLYTGVLNC